jgi:hypothetical protein
MPRGQTLFERGGDVANDAGRCPPVTGVSAGIWSKGGVPGRRAVQALSQALWDLSRRTQPSWKWTKTSKACPCA